MFHQSFHDKLVAKFADAMREADAPFGALVGTPVPAVIGTDFRALRRMAEKRTGKPVIALAAAGTGLYDRGEEEAYRELFRTFAGPGPARRHAHGRLAESHHPGVDAYHGPVQHAPRPSCRITSP